ncbi:MAG: tetratricopeptide repeat protein [Pyrinomonadaceae bacterium]
MPENFLDRYFTKAGHCILLFCLAFLCACQSAAEKESAALKQDAPVLSQLAQINNAINTTRSISPENFAALKTIREKYPNALEVRQTYKNALVIREDWQALEKFLTEKPLAELSAEDRQTLGKVYVKSGKYEQAIETLKALAEANPNDVETRSLLGLSFFYLDKNEEAGAQLDSVWDKIIAEKRIDEITTRGIIYSRQNNFPKAIETLKKAVEINPSSAAANNALAQVYARSGDAEQAEIYRAKTVEINDNAAALTFEASRRVQQIYELETAWKAKNYQEVINLANRILPTAVEKNQKIVLYQYLFESNKALGNQAEANNALTEAQKLQQQK